MAETYYELIEEYAKDFIEYYKEEIEEIIKENKDSIANVFEIFYQEWDLNGKIHEWLDSCWYGFLRESVFDKFNTEFLTCAFIIEESNNPSCMWEGEDPQETIITQAFYTVRNDLYFKIEEMIKEMIDKIGGD